jgi:hypothetical protein
LGKRRSGDGTRGIGQRLISHISPLMKAGQRNKAIPEMQKCSLIGTLSSCWCLLRPNSSMCHLSLPSRSHHSAKE